MTNITSENFISEVLNSCISDHEGQSIQIKDNYQKERFSCVKINYRIMTEENICNLKLLLKNEKWDLLLKSNNVNDLYRTFINKFQTHLNNTCPIVSKTIHRNKQHQNYCKNWITSGIIQSRKTLKLLHDQYLVYKSKDYEISYKIYKKIYDKVVVEAKRMAVDNYITNSKDKSKASWNIVNNYTGRNKTTNFINKIIENGKEIINPIEISSSINLFFSKMAQMYQPNTETKNQNSKYN